MDLSRMRQRRPAHERGQLAYEPCPARALFYSKHSDSAKKTTSPKTLLSPDRPSTGALLCDTVAAAEDVDSVVVVVVLVVGAAVVMGDHEV